MNWAYSPFVVGMATWAVGPGWYEVGPLALSFTRVHLPRRIHDGFWVSGWLSKNLRLQFLLAQFVPKAAQFF